MKDLGKTIDRIIKIEPSLDTRLIPIKTKWEKCPKRGMTYWEQLLKILNTEVGPQHPKRIEIQGVLTLKRKIPKKTYTFEPPTENETVVGVIPEHLEGRLKRYDRMQIDIAKIGLEARLTHNVEIMINLTRRAEILEIKQKKLWSEIKDYFKLWATEGPVTFLVRQQKDGCLVLTAIRSILQQQANHESDSFLMRLNPEVLKKFFNFLNIQPPPGFLLE